MQIYNKKGKSATVMLKRDWYPGMGTYDKTEYNSVELQLVLTIGEKIRGLPAVMMNMLLTYEYDGRFRIPTEFRNLSPYN